MTLRTITFDDEQWQVVPKQLTPEMLGAALWPACLSTDYALALAAAPEPQVCFCDEKGIGDPAKSCGDCPQDYGIPTVRANPEPPAQQPIRSITLTGAQIRDLAEFVGLGPMRFSPGRLDLETEVEISGPGDISDEAGKSTWFPLVACIAEYPEDGYIGLGDPLPAAGIGKGESDAD